MGWLAIERESGDRRGTRKQESNGIHLAGQRAAGELTAGTMKGELIIPRRRVSGCLQCMRAD